VKCQVECSGREQALVSSPKGYLLGRGERDSPQDNDPIDRERRGRGRLARNGRRVSSDLRC